MHLHWRCIPQNQWLACIMVTRITQSPMQGWTTVTTSHIISTTASPASHEPLTPLPFLERSATTFPEREAVVYGSRRSTYAAFEAEVQQPARALPKTAEPGPVGASGAPNPRGT